MDLTIRPHCTLSHHPPTAMRVLFRPSHTLGKSLRTQADTHSKAPRLRELSRVFSCTPDTHLSAPVPPQGHFMVHVTYALVRGIDRNQTPRTTVLGATVQETQIRLADNTCSSLNSRKVQLSGAGRLKTHTLTWGVGGGGSRSLRGFS